jgi:Protein of unknown function (DUF1573)
MRRIVLSFLVLLFIPATSFGSPAISFESLSHDFGMVGGEGMVRHVFDFSNRGDRELVIEKVSPS